MVGKSSITAIVAVGLTLTVIGAAFGQTAAQTQTTTTATTTGTTASNTTRKYPNWPPKPKPGPAEQDKYFFSKKLSRPPDLPGLPTYTGQTKLAWAYEFPEFNGYKVWDVRYFTKDDKNTVHDWFYAAFRGAGWQLQPGNQTPDVVSAKDPRTGTQILITTTGGACPGYKSMYYVRYIQVSRK
jgi:hypothetical protein